MSAAGLSGASRRLLPGSWTIPARAAFVAMVLTVLAAGLVGLLLLTTGMQQRAFTLFDLENEITDLREQRQLLVADLASRESPAALAESARLLGMVPNDTPVFLDLDRGTLRGELVPADAVPGSGL